MKFFKYILFILKDYIYIRNILFILGIFMNVNLKDLNRIVALGGGHGLARVMLSLSDLGSKLTGIVVTSDDGGSAGIIRKFEGGIAWGDIRNCLNQLTTKSSIISNILKYRFKCNSKLFGHSLGNLILKILDNLSMRPLEVINIMRTLLEIESYLIPMSEEAVDLIAISEDNLLIYGETAIDVLKKPPKYLKLCPNVYPTIEGLEFIHEADLILIGPGSFYTSLMPFFLIKEIVVALKKSTANIIFINNLSRETSPAASDLTLLEKLLIIKKYIGKEIIDALIVSSETNIKGIKDCLIIKESFQSIDIPYFHNCAILKNSLNKIVQFMY